MRIAEFTRVPTLPLIAGAVDRHIGSKAIGRSFDRVDVPRAILQNPGAALPMRQFFGLFEWFAREAGDDMFGIFAAEALEPESYGPFVTYALQGETLRTALIRIARGVRLHQSCSTMHLTEARGFATWTYSVDLPLMFGRHHHAIHTLLQMLAGMAQYLGFEPEILECGVEAESYGKRNALEDRLGVPIQWSSSSNYVRFPAHLLNLPSGTDRRTETPVSYLDLLRYARSAPPKTAREKAKIILLQGLESSTTTADLVARQLNIGVRTLQRRLDLEGTSFSRILEEVRREHARKLIDEGHLPLWQISDLLGYSDPAHFTRAYRRWHGHPPSQPRAYRHLS